MNKKDTKFQRKYVSNDKVKHKGMIWTVTKDAMSDINKHVHYKVCRGSWKEYVRGDKLISV